MLVVEDTRVRFTHSIFLCYDITIITEEDSLDWKPGYTVDTVVKSALKNVKPGSIMLLHIGAEPTTKALPIILQQLKKDGYELVLVEDLILKKDYVIDHTGKQCAK